MSRQKAHTQENVSSNMKVFIEDEQFGNKKKVKQKEKGPTKRFSYGLRSPKPQDKKIQKFLPHLVSGGIWKTRGEKKSC